MMKKRLNKLRNFLLIVTILDLLVPFRQFLKAQTLYINIGDNKDISMGLTKVALNFMVKNGKGELVKSLLCHTKPPKMPINIKGLKYNPLNIDTIQISHLSRTDNSTIKPLIDMGIKENDAEILVKVCPSEELLETLKFYKDSGSLNKLVPVMIEEYNRLCRPFGRNLNLGGYNKRISFPNELGDVDIMTLSRKHRTLTEFKNGELKCVQLPESAYFTAEEKVQKSLVDKAFKKIKGTDYDMFQYRGEVLSENSPYFQKLKGLKEGDIFDIPGYAWTTDSSRYAFGTYANGTKDMLEFFKKWNVKHHILCPEGTKIFASRSRLGQEFVMPCDSKMKLIKKEIDEANREIILYSEHIPS